VAIVTLYATFRVLLSSEFFSSSPTAQDCGTGKTFLSGGLHAMLKKAL